jgi:catechol 2,3-dioxygenase-like lactoylglutathione lyase family enzyme
VLNHVAVSVSNIELVVPWYTKVFGFQLINNTITHIKRSETPDAGIFSIYPSNLNDVKIAYMATGNGTGFEIFEFLDPKPVKPAQEFEYQRGGFFHVCVTDAMPEELAKTVIKEGGKMIGKMAMVGPYKCLYVADPWGNVVEILDTSFERLATAIA